MCLLLRRPGPSPADERPQARARAWRGKPPSKLPFARQPPPASEPGAASMESKPTLKQAAVLCCLYHQAATSDGGFSARDRKYLGQSYRKGGFSHANCGTAGARGISCRSEPMDADTNAAMRECRPLQAIPSKTTSRMLRSL